ncbi:MAG: anaerobic ribonucleoside-triphosphate reductase activating protein [Muribaculaceae bacterium]|nr:anaerobic ribonucleoside-triphosphate reductase activating protein [Muribaculaceae bacterium]
MFRVTDIIRGTTVDGPGFRTSIYFSGCSHQCPGCHNPQTWDPENGHEMSLSDILDIVEEEDFDVTLSGGDPLYFPEHIEELVENLKASGRNVWIYTGYTWEEIIKRSELYKAIKKADVLVDGPFIEALKDTDLKFRGSSNQRIIDIQKSPASGKPVIIED